MTNVQTVQESNTLNVNKEGPNIWNVIFYNDTFTPMVYVIEILQRIFGLAPNIAIELTMQIHTENSSIVASYYYEIAEQKASEALYDARTNGYPLKIEIHPNI